MDILEVKILEDGKLQITSQNISEARHLDADQLLDELEEMIGGVRERKSNPHPFWKNKKVQRGGKIVEAK